MAKVIITERDLTSSVINVDTTDIAYIPGFGDVKAKKAPKTGEPILITSISQFKDYFGKNPRTLTADYSFSANAGKWDSCSYDTLDPYNQYLAKAGDYDRSYIYAAELLNADMPIYYERVNDTNESIDPKDMYDALEGVNGKESILNKLIDKGTFNIKYLTTGGWPVFDYITRHDIAVEKYLYVGKINQSSEKLDAVNINKSVYIKNGDIIYSNSMTLNIDVDDDADGSRTVSIITEDQISEKAKLELYINEELSETFTVKLQDEHYTTLIEDDSKIERPIFDNMMSICMQRTQNDVNGRGDCLALIDHTDNPSRPLNTDDPDSVYRRMNDYASHLNATGSFGAMFTPWHTFALDTVIRALPASGSTKTYGELIGAMDLPGSFAYLRALSRYVRDYSKNHEAVAGPIRGRVSNAIPRLDNILTNTIADSYQTEVTTTGGDDDAGVVSINAITNIYPYNQVIWGNRTLAPKDDEDGVKATHFINIRNMVSDIRKAAYRAARKYMFEQNSEILWFNFKSELIPTLENFKTSYGITAYKIKKLAQEKTWLHVEVIIKPVYAVEEFKINLVIQDEDITVDETAAEEWFIGDNR